MKKEIRDGKPTIEEIKERYKEQLSELKSAIEDRDWEVVHSTYDDVVFDIASKAEPDFFSYLEDITKDSTFWYA